MSGNPSEAEVQTQWSNAIRVLEFTRAFAETAATPIVGASGLLDLLLQDLEGEYTPSGLSAFAQRYRASLSSLVEPGRALEVLTPVLFEYARLISYGGGYTDIGEIMRALYEHFVNNSLTVESRAITYDTSATTGPSGSNVGNGVISRLTVDENNFNLEACTVETKRFRCRRDQNSGVDEQAEEFECIGEAPSQDSLLRYPSGSGTPLGRFIRSHHSGTGRGGSLLRNSSFSTFSATASPKFAGWTETSGGSNLTQDTTNYYREHPPGGTSTRAALKISGNAVITQPLSAMLVTSLDTNTPYFLRVMYNRAVGSGSMDLAISLGSQSNSVTLSAQTGWNELLIPIDTNLWFKNFNADPLTVTITVSSYGSGFVLVDDAILAPWDLIDGTYWMLRGNASTHIPWLVDDELIFTDTGGAPATGKIQWWLFHAGLGYLPSAATPTFADPSG